ncbi:MAG: SDR family NAD(P)-dependent oxidoreductase [Gammaproteobacteria bacterium]|nr:SDR family NAD(P)-dependent oxidoreductase [Gammaproteobacteria bacterium]NIT42424.1 SDR family NAD(P)-dependent oxidoreductase [Gammaproteobacteria bacterium]
MTNKQTILIAGATGSIGGGAAVALAKRGARVVLLGRSADKLKAKVDHVRVALSEAQIDYQDADIATLVIDFSDMESVRLAAKEAMNRFPMIHGLILSVAVTVQHGPNILPSGHEVMFATNVMGPFLFTQLLLERMQQSDGLVLHVIAPFYKEIDWDDLESIKNHKTEAAFNRTKTCNRVIAAELARRYAGKISSVAFNPSFIFDKTDPEVKKTWLATGPAGFFWWMMAVFFAKPPAVAGEPIADLMLSYRDRSAINGALFKLDKRVEKPDKAMNDEVLGKRLWDELVLLTGL